MGIAKKLKKLLGKQDNAFIDHEPAFRALFAHRKFAHVLEFGLGEGTRFFLEHAQQVHSVELVITDNPESSTHEWFDLCRKKFADYTNWKAENHLCSEAITQANAAVLEAHDYPGGSGKAYYSDLAQIVENALKASPVDLAFVDPAVHMRGDIVNLLLGRVDVVVAHDTNCTPEIYGWNIVKTPANTTRLHYAKGQGTTFWIRDNKELVEALKAENEHFTLQQDG